MERLLLRQAKETDVTYLKVKELIHYISNFIDGVISH